MLEVSILTIEEGLIEVKSYSGSGNIGGDDF